ncbi:MAG: beta-galactosidase [Phycisphaeraceae bacterium]|nr:beta-galactosidase [Phycisphaeraceae bacterium]
MKTLEMPATSTHAVTVGRDYLSLDGKPFFSFGGDFNYTRTPRRHWRDRLLKMKAAGMNTVTFYITWGYHEPVEGHVDWSGDKDVAAFLDMIHDCGMVAITRHGPFVHGEWRNGGLPQWLIDKLTPSRVRTNDPQYLDLTAQWYEQQMRIIIPRLYTRGGPIVMMQLENELGSAGSKGDDIARGSADPEENARHVMYYYNLVRQHGADVPIIDISHWPGREEKIALLVDTSGGYPSACFSNEGEIWPMNPARWEKHQRPHITIETGSSMFVRFYDLPPYKNTSGYQGPILDPACIEALSLGHLAEGASGINYYMVTDGQHCDGGNERMLPERDVNFQSPITAVGSLRESYRWLKRLGWMLRSFEQELLKAQPNATWASAFSYGKSHPGVEQSGDLFEGYHRENSPVPADLKHVAKVESVGRCTKGLNLSETNFLFMRNAKVHGTRWLRDIRVETNARGIPCETSREYPARVQMSLPPQRNRVMPFYVRIQPRTFLEYSTAQLLDRRPFGDGTQLILHADANETYETALVAERTCPIRNLGQCLPLWENPNTVSLIGRPGVPMTISILDLDQPVRVVHLERELAGNVWDLDSPRGPVVAITNLSLLDGGKTVQAQQSDYFLWILAPTEPHIAGLAGNYDEAFGLYHASGNVTMPAPTLTWTRHRQGNIWTWEADVDPELLAGTHDVVLRINYQGACARAYLNEKLISDHYFGRFLVWEVGLRDWLKSPGKLLLAFEDTLDAQLQIAPVIEWNWNINW